VSAALPVRVLAATEYFLPGFRAGGPVRTLSNLAQLLAGRVEFAFITRDHDAFQAEPYPGIETDRWTGHAGFPVWYASRAGMRSRALRAAVCAHEHDVLYLNSLWSEFSRKLLVLRRRGRLPARPVVLAPRGELFPGALRVRTGRKLAWLAFARASGLLRGVLWEAPTEEEAALIRRHVGADARVAVAPNPAATGSGHDFPRPPKQPGELRALYLSRVSESKNLLEALHALAGVPGRVTFDIYGTIEREEYWQRCRRAMDALPANVRAAYRGPVSPDRVEETLAGYHLFFVPTRGENFGHAIVEALTAGCPVLIGDQTPWRQLSRACAGWEVPSEDVAAMRRALAQAIAMDGAEWSRWAEGARRYVRAAVRPDEARDRFWDLLTRALQAPA
jgi:glycosyltransferase involved in cell wall biosynthesis